MVSLGSFKRNLHILLKFFKLARFKNGLLKEMICGITKRHAGGSLEPSTDSLKRKSP